MTTIAAAVAAWIARARRLHGEAVEAAEIERFRSLIESLPDERLSRLHEDYQLLAALDTDREFHWKRNACLEELNKRAMKR